MESERKLPRKNLLLFRPTLGQGGADRVTLTLMQSFDRELFAPSLVLVKREGEFLGDLPEDIDLTVLGVQGLRAAALPLKRLLEERQPDIFFSTSSGANPVAIMAHKLARQSGRLVISERGLLRRGKVTAKKRAVLALKRALYARADAITAVSDGVRDDLVRELGLARERITVVYNPIVTDEMAEQAAEPVEHEWFGENVPVILGAGRLVEEKDFGTLIRVFAIVRAKCPVRLVILGEGPLREDLERLARELGIERDFALPGFYKNPFKYMARCSVFVLSSRFEGLPGVLIQAMACGAPVIATDCPSGPSEIITPNADGMLVPVGDMEAMVAAIERVLGDAARAGEMGARARLSAERFRVDNVLSRYAQALLAQQER